MERNTMPFSLSLLLAGLAKPAAAQPPTPDIDPLHTGASGTLSRAELAALLERFAGTGRWYGFSSIRDSLSKELSGTGPNRMPGANYCPRIRSDCSGSVRRRRLDCATAETGCARAE